MGEKAPAIWLWVCDLSLLKRVCLGQPLSAITTMTAMSTRAKSSFFIFSTQKSYHKDPDNRSISLYRTHSVAYHALMKEMVTISFRRLPDGEIVADIVDEKGLVIETRSFGKCSPEEYEQLAEVINREMPAPGTMAVRVTGN